MRRSTRFGRLDAVVGNAAMGVLRPIAEGRVEEWTAVLETNLIGTMVLCRAALRHLLPQRRGDILLMGSAAASGAWPYFGAYAASKAGVLALARTLRAEVAGQGVRVMTIDIHNVGGTDFAAGLDPELLAAGDPALGGARHAQPARPHDHAGRRGARGRLPARANRPPPACTS